MYQHGKETANPNRIYFTPSFYPTCAFQSCDLIFSLLGRKWIHKHIKCSVGGVPSDPYMCALLGVVVTTTVLALGNGGGNIARAQEFHIW